MSTHAPMISTDGAHRSSPPAGSASGSRQATGEHLSGHIPEIDGLRAIAITLIVIYHVWLSRVSGGVDVFLLLSGFLITMSLVRAVERHGRIRFVTFYARIVRRIFPPALVVLIGVVVATVLWLPQTRWRETLADIVASALYVVNWHLANDAVDYLASQNAASPVQHYWSLAIQGQFYLTWPLVIAAAALLAARLAVHLRLALAVLLGAVFVASLAYSVHRTAVDQVYTYFDTFARIWEFALGGLLLLALPYLRLPRAAAATTQACPRLAFREDLRLPRAAATTLGWVGLAALVTCGLVFRAGNEFPGWAALWPTLAAALVIATAGSGSALGADRLLRTGLLRRLGALSYALYLWHWPVLIYYLAVTGRSTPSLRGGILVITASVVLAVGTKWLLEDRLRTSGIGQRTNLGGLALGAACLAAVVATTATWHGYMYLQQQSAQVTPMDPRIYPGAAYLTNGGALPTVPHRPNALDAKGDRAVVYDSGCHQNPRDSDVRRCDFGPADAERTIALVGGSHSAHWLPALQELTEKNSWRIVSMTKSTCRFSADRGGENASCHEWNDNVIAELATLRPDAVFTTSTVGQSHPETTPEGYLAQWRVLDDLGIPVLAIRDTPWHDFDVPECVEAHRPDARACGGERAAHGLDRPALVEARADIPGSVYFLDLTDYVCEEDFCPAVVGNVLVYHDRHHLSATYARTLAPFLDSAIHKATGWPTP